MHDARAWSREGRLLIIIADDTRARHASRVDDVVAVDFLLQHPSALARFAETAGELWGFWTRPSVAETESTEEVLLHWKRALGARVVAPLLGRLIARGQVSHRRAGRIVVTTSGLMSAERLVHDLDDTRLERLTRTAADFRDEPLAAHARLRLVLDERAD
jgi:hypothetical protein